MIPLGALSYNSENTGNFERDQAFSVETWLRASADVTNAGVIGHMDGLRGWGLGSHGSRGKITAFDIFLIHDTGNSLTMAAVGPLSLANNVWHHVAFTYNGSSQPAGIKLYINSVNIALLIAANSLTGTIKNNGKFQVGKHYYPNFAGSFDEVTVYDRVLSAVEIGQRYNGGAGTENLFGASYLHWQLNELSGDTVTDSSGFGRNGKTINSPSWIAGKLNNCISLNGSTQYLET